VRYNAGYNIEYNYQTILVSKAAQKIKLMLYIVRGSHLEYRAKTKLYLRLINYL